MERRTLAVDTGDGSRGPENAPEGHFPEGALRRSSSPPKGGQGDQDRAWGILMKAGIFGPKFVPLTLTMTPQIHD